MNRIHGGTPSGRPLRYRIQAMGEKEVTDCKKYTANGLVRRGCPSGQPVMRFGHTYSCMMVGFYEHELRPFLGLRCGVPPRQTHDCITTVCYLS